MNPQLLAADPSASVFVTANAGSGKTSTLVDRVARLLLRGASPQAILCVTYTKAAAAEMQSRLFAKLGDWAVMEDAALDAELARIDEAPSDLSAARALFARALETPGGLKIQTIHAFCEKLLQRFPLEAGVSPGFTVLEDSAALQVSAEARDDVARLALANPDGPVGRAYAHLSVEVDFRSFEAMFATFEARRQAIGAYVDAAGDVEADVWNRLGFDAPTSPQTLRAEAMAALDLNVWRAAAQALYAGGKFLDCAADLARVAEGAGDFDLALSAFCTKAGEMAKWVETAAAIKADPALQQRLIGEREKLFEARSKARAAVIARDTVHVLTLGYAYRTVYEGAKARAAGLDFADLIARTHELLTIRADAAWVLYKLDGGIDHLLLDEAQDTAPDQWDILRALTAEFFSGAGAAPRPRSVFAVGDEKQSIYSFQGAAPERFLDEAREHRELIEGTGGLFRQVPLHDSWRSTAQVLAFVDAVYAAPQALAGLRPEGPMSDELVVHNPRRKEVGCVDVWPLEEGEVQEEADPWAPVDIEPAESANKRLARRIAAQVGAMIDRREAVIDKKTGQPRPMHAGDVLILVRRRKALFHEIIRALKRAGVPVGGQDRLTLSDHIVFKDLLALARLALFPGDDLTLAALLRSPFCDLDEQSLYDLAQGREGALWDELGRRSAERPQWAAALAFLNWARRAASELGPFDFYGRVLSRLDGEGRSMRARILTRLGREAEDALDAFLAECLSAEERGLRDLESFAAAMASTEIEVKREQEDSEGKGLGEVRVMTVHGAKGLEAPVVILPDTTSTARAMGSPLFRGIDGGFVWAPRKTDDCELSADLRQARETASTHESLRLLYVALTRARDRLIVCGVRRSDRKSGYEAGCWYETILPALARPEIAERLRHVEIDGLEIARFGADPQIADAALAMTADASPLPAWVRGDAPAGPDIARYASPSQLAESRHGPSPSPLAQAGGIGRFRRGDIIHRLLQLLPDIDPAERRAAAQRLLAREPELSDEQRGEMATAAFGVLDDAQFAEVFGPGSRAEAALAGTAKGLPKGLAVSGRVDRLVVTPTRVLVVDYKTNRPAPATIEDADEAYRVQMAVYAAVLREVFPGRAVEAALVWTDGPKLMAVPEKVMADSLSRLR